MEAQSNSQRLTELAELTKYLTPQQKNELDSLLTQKIWIPLPGPQTTAFNTDADITFYGGSAGGGKTDLAIGLALTKHEHSIIYRREAKQLQAIIDRLATLLKTRDGFNSQTNIWRLPAMGKQIELGGVKNLGDEMSYQGRPHDLKVFDEITHFLEIQFRFLMGWLRSDNPDIPKRVLCTGNPPTDSTGDWVVKFWGPWLDPDHPNPAKPNELRWYAMIDGKETEVTEEPFKHKGELIIPKSRTFIPSSVEDNPYLMSTGYKAQLQALPEPLRSQMLNGDFLAGTDDDPWQTIPTEWVKTAQERWKEREKKGPMDSMGVDVARGGRDETILSRRHGNWYDELLVYPGKSTPDGPAVASLVVAYLRDGAPLHVDIIGVGTSVYDHLKENNLQTVAMNGAEKSMALDRSGKLKFVNKRAEWYWKMREDLDPKNDEAISLPPGTELKADLCAPRWKLTPRGIQIEAKEDLIKRLGRSTDRGDAVVYARVQTSKSNEWNQPINYSNKGIT